MNIDEKTKISLFAALASIPFLVGGIIWLSSIEQKASAAQNDMRDLKPVIEEIRDRVIRIEEQLKTRRK